jgi:hypothetical protein
MGTPYGKQGTNDSMALSNSTPRRRRAHAFNLSGGLKALSCNDDKAVVPIKAEPVIPTFPDEAPGLGPKYLAMAMKGTWMDKSIGDVARQNHLLKELEQARRVYGENSDVYREFVNTCRQLGYPYPQTETEKPGRKPRSKGKDLNEGSTQQCWTRYGTTPSGRNYPLFGDPVVPEIETSDITSRGPVVDTTLPNKPNFGTVLESHTRYSLRPGMRAFARKALPAKANQDVSKQVLAKSRGKAKVSSADCVLQVDLTIREASLTPKVGGRKARRRERQKEAVEQVAGVHDKLKTFKRVLQATKRTAMFCLKDLASTLIEARKSRVEIVHLGVVQKEDMSSLDLFQRHVADDAAGLEAIAEDIIRVVGEFRGYGYVPAQEGVQDWMLDKLTAVLRKHGGAGEAQNGEASGQEVFYVDPLLGPKTETPVVTQDVDMGTAA